MSATCGECLCVADTSTITRGGFINTLAFQQGAWTTDGVPAYGTIRTMAPVRCIAWPTAALRTLLEGDANFRMNIDHVLVSSLMRRLLKSRDGTHVQDYIGAAPDVPHIDHADERPESASAAVAEALSLTKRLSSGPEDAKTRPCDDTRRPKP